jgi:hypothetical protein
MLKFTTSSFAGALAVGLMAGAGILLLHLPGPTPVPTSATAHTHVGGCNTCRAPYYALPGQPSSHGLDPNVGNSIQLPGPRTRTEPIPAPTV